MIGRDQLPEDRADDHDQQAEQRRIDADVEVAVQRVGVLRAERAAAEETGEGQHADDEALAVAAEPERRGRRRSGRRRGCPSGAAVGGQPATTTLRSHGGVPAGEREQPVEHAGGEPPDQHVGDPERRRLETDRVPDGHPVRRVDELARPAPARPPRPRPATRLTPRSAPPPRDDRRDDVAARRNPQLGQQRRAPRRRSGRARSPPALRAARRRPARRRSGSIRPPGNAGCPAWLRMSALRCISRTSGPSGPSPNSASTAASRSALRAVRRRDAGTARRRRRQARRRAAATTPAVRPPTRCHVGTCRYVAMSCLQLRRARVGHRC